MITISKSLLFQFLSFTILTLWFFSMALFLNHNIQQDSSYEIYLKTKYSLDEKGINFYSNPYKVPFYYYIYFSLSMFLLMYNLEYLFKQYYEQKHNK